MKLTQLIAQLPITVVGGVSDSVEINGISQDSRSFTAGDLFIAVKGKSFDGHQFASQALAEGAAAVLVENAEGLPPSGVVLQTASTKALLNPLAKRFYQNPTESLLTVGVTGTNGKTTSTYMIEAVLNAGKIPTCVFGTIDTHFKNQAITATHTTPDPISLQSHLAQWQKAGAKAAVLEVSSHALIQERVNGLDFDMAVFTNLTRDHLDFHGTVENYVKAKGLLFHKLLNDSPKKNKRAIINAEDPHFAAFIPRQIPTWTYGFKSGDLIVEEMKLSFEGTTLKVKTPAGLFQGHLAMVGRHNVANALAAIAVGIHAGVKLDAISQALEKLKGVPGRLQRVQTPSPLRVFVDYAHTDDGLVNVLSFLKQMRDETSPTAKIITVFGCGGDRDKGKRPLMMRAALQFSDFVVVTSDNPRTEVPRAIIDNIIAETPADLLKPGGKIAVDEDRRQAIQLAVERANAQNQDVVLIAGKGHENYQIIGRVKHDFDDLKIASEILEKHEALVHR